MVEQWIENPWVSGSNPLLDKNTFVNNYQAYSSVVERTPDKREVSSSNLLKPIGHYKNKIRTKK